MVQTHLPQNIHLTTHIVGRMSQRSIPCEHIAYALLHGKRKVSGDCAMIFLRKRDILPEDKRDMQDAAGLVVIFDESTEALVTAYYRDHYACPLKKVPRELRRYLYPKIQYAQPWLEV